MALTNAERQKAYRQRRKFEGPDNNGERQLNTWISTKASVALKRLAKSYVVTERALIEKLILEADQTIADGLEFESPEYNRYYGNDVIQ